MRAVVQYGVRDIRVDDRPEPRILAPGDAVVRVVAVLLLAVAVLVPFRLARRRVAAQRLKDSTSFRVEMKCTRLSQGRLVALANPGLNDAIPLGLFSTALRSAACQPFRADQIQIPNYPAAGGTT